ncbi:MAG: hypothetical protein VR65_17510 [Desulfobulbaceae bacterium BRH_c16a]|nr:MAG: hypothetical protein VR65_17510 [Desulfobulbaceae bacterium BRH_c16a]
MARLWADAVNGHGGDVTLVHLPAIGIRGNTHFPFSDLNNIEIADLLSKWLEGESIKNIRRRSMPDSITRRSFIKGSTALGVTSILGDSIDGWIHTPAFAATDIDIAAVQGAD